MGPAGTVALGSHLQKKRLIMSTGDGANGVKSKHVDAIIKLGLCSFMLPVHGVCPVFFNAVTQMVRHLYTLQ